VTVQGSPGTVEETGTEVVVDAGIGGAVVVEPAKASVVVAGRAELVEAGGAVVVNSVVSGEKAAALVEALGGEEEVLVACGTASWRVGVAGSLQAAPRTNRAATKTRRGSAVISL
jgi:hypothetical protein